VSRSRLLRIVRPVAALPAPVEPRDATPASAARAGRWSRLAAPVFPADTHAMAQALSALAGMDFQDGSRAPGALTVAQARDVAAWYRTRRIT
jgi:hypothetical protein